MDLTRFIKAQQNSYATALKEIQNGHKVTHWMWYIFPQIKGLGRSSTAQYYAINDLQEAKAYLEDEYLRSNLYEITSALLALDADDPYVIFGHIDALKLRSSMTLFAYASDDPTLFLQVLDQYYHGRQDQRTIKILKSF